MAGYFDEVLEVREMLNSRYEVVAPLPRKERSRSPDAVRFMITCDFHPEARIDLDESWDFIAERNPDAADR